MKVYGWQGWRTEAGPRMQTREIVMARSMIDVARIAGFRHPRQMFNLGETGNAGEIAKATTSPGTIFWCPLDQHPRDFKP